MSRRRGPRALTRKLLRDLARLRGQVASIAAVVACGVMMVVSMYGTLHSVGRAVDAYYRARHFADVFATATRAPAWVAERVAAVDGVSGVAPRVTLVVSLDVPALDLPAGGRLVSLPDDDGAAALQRIHLRAGRRPHPHRDDEVVVSTGFAAANRIAVGDTLGAVMEGRRRTLTVVGLGMAPEFVWELSASGAFTADERAFGVLWMPRRAVEVAAGMRGGFNDLAVSLGPGADRARVLAAIDTLLAPWGGTGAVGRDRHPSHAVVAGELRSLRVFGLLLPAIFLTVAAFLINVVLARLVATQRSEIAALKAFGYTDREVAAHFLGFASAATLLGCVVGILAGLVMGSLYTGLYLEVLRLPELRFVVEPRSTLASVVVSVCAGMVGAVGAVRAAARLAPAEALRPESPERYGPLLLERLGIAGVVPPAERMVLRQIERRPARALSTIVGVALALALLAGTLALFDSAFYMMDLQFRRAQREDVAVGFAHARPVAALDELARLPGVTRAEGTRVVPVRVRAGAMVRTVALTGVAADAMLHRVVDRDARVLHVPPDGALVTTAFARLLGVGVGDTLALELLERGGSVRRVVVASLADEPFGNSLHMEQDALARLLGEERRITGAQLRVEADSLPALLARLKRLPAVTGASSREALIAAWDRQMLESIRVSGTLVVICAAVIAVGAIYNGARIALSERGRELASLRVLGFRRREVAALLFGEQAALTLAGLPLGVALGAGLAVILARGFVTEDQRFPVVLVARTYVGAILVVLLAAVGAGLLMRRRLDRMDLVAVLKTRE